jgi:hypothetical protein
VNPFSASAGHPHYPQQNRSARFKRFVCSGSFGFIDHGFGKRQRLFSRAGYTITRWQPSGRSLVAFALASESRFSPEPLIGLAAPMMSRSHRGGMAGHGDHRAGAPRDGISRRDVNDHRHLLARISR